MKIAALVGSIRKESYNLKLARYMQKRFKDRMDIEILSLRELPLYDQDIENDRPAAVKEFVRKVAEADAVLFATPEYNYSIPGILKNAIDWLSRVDKVMIGKPSWIVGASGGAMGTVRAQLHLRDILFSPGINSPLLPVNEVYVSAAQDKFDSEGNLIHEPTIQFLDKVTDHFLHWVEQVKRIK